MKLKCVNIATTNIIEMRDFYSLVLDKPYYERNSCRYEIPIDNATIVITHSDIKTVVNPDCCGLEFEVDNVDEKYRILYNAGLKIETLPVTLPWDYKYFAIKDPDGNNIDFVQYIGK